MYFAIGMINRLKPFRKYDGNQFYVFSLRHLIGHYIFTNRNQTKIQAQYHHDNIVDILSLLSLYFHTA